MNYSIIIRSKEEWQRIAIEGLDDSFQALRESREILLNSKSLDPKTEEMFRQAGAYMLQIVKTIRKKNEKLVNKKAIKK